MRLVHLSDLHLGFRQYQRLTPGGVNQREADVAATFRASIDRVIELSPDVVAIAGDIFHSVRPSNQAILHAFMQFSRLRRSLPNAKIILIAGNHDTPRSSESGGILRLFEQIGLFVVDKQATLLPFPDIDLEVLCVPDVPNIVQPSYRPSGNARFNVLVVHGKIPGVVPDSPADGAVVEIPLAELGASRWDYIALGHYHVYREVTPNAYYSGSIDYTNLNMWAELRDERESGITGKGLIERDLATGEHTFHPVRVARPLIELEPVRAGGLTPAEVDLRIRAAAESCKGGIDDKIVRLMIWDITRTVARELDHKAIRDLKRRALSFNLDLRAPDIRPSSAGGAPGRRPSLNEMVREKLLARTLDADIDRAALVSTALAYLDEAQALNVAPSAVLEL